MKALSNARCMSKLLVRVHVRTYEKTMGYNELQPGIIYAEAEPACKKVGVCVGRVPVKTVCLSVCASVTSPPPLRHPLPFSEPFLVPDDRTLTSAPAGKVHARRPRVSIPTSSVSWQKDR